MKIEEMARRQLADYDAHRLGLLFEDPAISLSLDEAYAVQAQVAAAREARGERLAGYKIGCTSEAIQRQLGVGHPVFGCLFESEFRRSGETMDLREFDHLAIEGELAVRIGEDLEIVSAFVVIELHNYVFRSATPNAAELVANNCLHAGVVLSEREFGFPALPEPISVYRNGVLLGTAATDSVESVQKIREWGQVRPGQILLTGSPLPLYPVEAGDEILVQSPHAGEVRVRISGTGLWQK